jgi:GT2 family glycosyltransferase
VRDGTRPATGRPELNEDIEFQTRVRAAGGEVWFVPDAVVHHRTPVPSPRVCLAKGFAAGRNDYRRAPRPGVPSDRRRGARSARSWAAWASAAIRWLWWSAALRVARTRTAFGRAWDASWATGWRMEDLLSDDVRDGADRRVRRLMRRVTRLASRLTPDTP